MRACVENMREKKDEGGNGGEVGADGGVGSDGGGTRSAGYVVKPKEEEKEIGEKGKRKEKKEKRIMEPEKEDEVGGRG